MATDAAKPKSATAKKKPPAEKIGEVRKKLAASELTLDTLRDWAGRNENLTGLTMHGRGYRQAARDVVAILAKHGCPPDEPALLSTYDEVFIPGSGARPLCPRYTRSK